MPRSARRVDRLYGAACLDRDDRGKARQRAFGSQEHRTKHDQRRHAPRQGSTDQRTLRLVGRGRLDHRVAFDDQAGEYRDHVNIARLFSSRCRPHIQLNFWPQMVGRYLQVETVHVLGGWGD